MGIQGLLPYLKKSSVPCNVRQFKGQTAAIDSYCWLHRGAFACAEKLALGEKTDQYVYYCMKFLNMLLANGIKPIMVFDGCRLPSKQDVEKARREQRDANRKRAAELLREGKRSEARNCLAKCIDITPSMALELMQACRKKGLDCIVAPYEADAQLAYLNKIGVAQVIITEDSDLVLFGCDKILFKMDVNGNGVLIERSKLNISLQIPKEIYCFEKFRYICILSGCDYIPSLPGIGLVKATKLIKLSRQPDIRQLIRKIPTSLNMAKLVVTEEYIEAFVRADNTFLYQLVYDPIKRCILPLTPYLPHINPVELKYAGPTIEDERAYQIALGNINVNTGEIMCDFDPDMRDFKGPSIWDKDYRVREEISSVKEESIIDTSTHGKQLLVNVPSFKMKHGIKTQSLVDDQVNLQHFYDGDHDAITKSPHLSFSHHQSEISRLPSLDVDSDCAIISFLNNSVHDSPAKKKSRSLSPRFSDQSDFGGINSDYVIMDRDQNKQLDGNDGFVDGCARGSLKEKNTVCIEASKSSKSLNNFNNFNILDFIAIKTNLDIIASQEKIVSPKRQNIFAVKKVEEKPAFSLNMSPSDKVDSRFFTAMKAKQDSLFFQKLNQQMEDEKVEIPESRRSQVNKSKQLENDLTFIHNSIESFTPPKQPPHAAPTSIKTPEIETRSGDPVSARLSKFVRGNKIYQHCASVKSTSASMPLFINKRHDLLSSSSEMISDEDPLPKKYTKKGVIGRRDHDYKQYSLDSTHSYSTSLETPAANQAVFRKNFFLIKPRSMDKENEEFLEEDPMPLPSNYQEPITYLSEDPLFDNNNFKESINYTNERPLGDKIKKELILRGNQHRICSDNYLSKRSSYEKVRGESSSGLESTTNQGPVDQANIFQFFKDKYSRKRRSLQFPF